jgi:hypothetical protein
LGTARGSNGVSCLDDRQFEFHSQLDPDEAQKVFAKFMKQHGRDPFVDRRPVFTDRLNAPEASREKSGSSYRQMNRDPLR